MRAYLFPFPAISSVRLKIFTVGPSDARKPYAPTCFHICFWERVCGVYEEKMSLVRVVQLDTKGYSISTCGSTVTISLVIEIEKENPNRET